ncbi:MAG: hypothetical protein ACR2JW_16120 [Thermomicrobiales bacterium]
MFTAEIRNLERTVSLADWQQARTADPFVRVAAIAAYDPQNGIVRIRDAAVLCGNCGATIGAYPPERVYPANQITGRGRWVRLLAIYTNHDGDPFYYARAETPGRAHTAWNETPDVPPDMLAWIAGINARDGLAAVATVATFEHFKVKCHNCTKINRVEVVA